MVPETGPRRDGPQGGPRQSGQWQSEQTQSKQARNDVPGDERPGNNQLGNGRPGGWTARQKLVVAVFMLFAVLVGAAAGYLAHWARQEAGAELGRHRAGEAVPATATRPGETEVRLDPGEMAPGGEPDGGGDETSGEATDEAEPDEAAGPRPRIAIIIDDWGYNWSAAPGFLAFPERLTIAVLPFLPFSVAQAEQALAAGHEVIVHMPMEAQSSSLDIGPGGVYVGMDQEVIADAVAAALATVPGAVGLNNHMGSRATADTAVMRAVLGVLREQGKFFVDSYTTAATVGPAVARELGLPYAVNRVFLDHEDDEEFIRRQIRRLANLARRRGYAVGIGHVRPNTYKVLLDMLPELQAEGFEFVTVSQLLTVPEAASAVSSAANMLAGSDAGQAEAAGAEAEAESVASSVDLSPEPMPAGGAIVDGN